MKNLLPKIIDVICFGIGTLFFVIGVIYAFRYSLYQMDGIERNTIKAGIGAFLIVLGFLIRSWRKDKINSN
jgi:hypothetical protein